MARPFRRGRRLVLKAKFAAERFNDQMRERLGGNDTVPLEQVQRRLELLLSAIYGRSIPIKPIDTSVWNRERVRQLASRDPRAREPTPGADGETIFLPPELSTADDADRAIARYRLFAIEQAERITRGTLARVPSEDPLERDLYLLREAEAIDAHIARAHPGLVAAIADERQAALLRRPKLDQLTPAERRVEEMLRARLGAKSNEGEAGDTREPGDAGVAEDDIDAADPDASLRWARDTAQRIRETGAEYRGLPPSALWGTMRSAGGELASPNEVMQSWLATGNTDSAHTETERSRFTLEAEHGGGTAPSQSMTLPDDGDGNSRAPSGAAEPDADDDRAGDRVGAPDERPASTNGRALAAPLELEQGANLPPAIYYDEWNANAGVYVKRGAAVRPALPIEGDEAWAGETLRGHAATVRQIRHQFERLRARRTLLPRQRAGDELDLAAYVDAVIARRVGDAPDDRLYRAARPARRGLAIALLADVSGSTETRVNESWRIIDLEKIALLLATQALDALGDLYAVYAFAGKTSDHVKLTTIKAFAERSGPTVQRRIAGLTPGGFTRLGAAVRHATHELARQSSGHRLLLLLSDGRPNDVDLYQGPYGVEDSRQAMAEARARGVYPFCLNVDPEGHEYLARIFGPAGYTTLLHPDQLPRALLEVVRRLVTS